jgi:hypothetical protein
MKRITLLSFLLIFSAFAICQTNTYPYPASGNIGIGTTNPLEKLHIQNGNLILSNNTFVDYTMGTIKFSSNAYNYAWSGIAGISNGQGWDQMDLVFYTAYGNPAEKMRLMSNTGNLGIGTSAPLAKLDVRGDARFESGQYWGALNMNSSSYLGVRIGLIQSPITNLNSTDAFIGALNTGGPVGLAGDLLLIPRSTTGIPNAIRFFSGSTTPVERLTITSNGSIGINNASPDPGAKLDVSGNIYSNGKIFIGMPDANTANKIAPYSLAVDGPAVFTKAVVKLNSAWPDYVFSADYKMPQLDTLEQFIKINKHLPEIPSAFDVDKNGVDLGSNQALLLKKIEELTLIVIEQNKRIEKLEKERIK